MAQELKRKLSAILSADVKSYSRLMGEDESSPPKTVAKADPQKMAYALPDKPSIAVLPFTNMSDDKEQEYFADGLAEEIINALSKIDQLFVIARNSTFTYNRRLFIRGPRQ